jgi:hypothetical protein
MGNAFEKNKHSMLIIYRRLGLDRDMSLVWIEK